MATAHLEKVSKVARMIMTLDHDYPILGEISIIRTQVDCAKCSQMLVRIEGDHPGDARHLACMTCGVIVQSFFQKS